MRIAVVSFSENLFPTEVVADVDVTASGQLFAHQLSQIIEAAYPTALVAVVVEHDVGGTPPAPEVILDAEERKLVEEAADIAQRIAVIEAELVASGDWLVTRHG